MGRKTKSRKYLSGARVINTQDGVRLQLEAAAKEPFLEAKSLWQDKKKNTTDGKEPAKRGRPKRIELLVESTTIESSENVESSEIVGQMPDTAVPVVLDPLGQKKVREGRR